MSNRVIKQKMKGALELNPHLNVTSLSAPLFLIYIGVKSFNVLQWLKNENK